MVSEESIKEIFKKLGYQTSIGNHGLIFVTPIDKGNSFTKSFPNYQEAYIYYIEPNKMSAIVYQESDFYIKNITTFSQYVLNLAGNLDDAKLITIMGEYHDEKFDCKEDKKSIMVDEYVIEQSKDCKTKLILELDDKSYVDRVKADNITRIVKKLDESPIEDIKNIETIYNDYRVKFLDPIFYNKLYWHVHEVVNYPPDIIIDKYIKPFFEKMTELSNLDSVIEKYNREFISKLYDTYISNLDKSFRIVIDMLKKWNTKVIVSFKDINGLDTKGDINLAIVGEIQKLWVRVSDFFLLRQFFENNDTKQYIILIGQAHYFNIINYLDAEFASMQDYTLTKIGRDKNMFIIYKFIHGKQFDDKDCIDSKGTANVVIKDKTRGLRRVNPKIIKKIDQY